MKYYSGKLNSVFVSRFNYPNTSVSLLVGNDSLNKKENKSLLPTPLLYRKINSQINDIVKSRKSLLNSAFQSGIYEKTKRINDMHELIMARKPVDVEVNFKKNIINSNDLTFDNKNIDMPISKYNDITQFKAISNVPFIKPVEKIYYDKDISLTQAFKILNKKVDIYKLIDLFSSGALGKKLNKKLVPTKWSITASDDIASKHLIEEIRNFKFLSKFELYYSYYLGNHYLSILLPSFWSYELYEFSIDNVIDKDKLILNKSNHQLITLNDNHTDYEGFYGRKEYAYNCVGGYYAVRNSLTKYLYERKKQASALIFRFIDKSYYKPLGVWVCREASNFNYGKSIGFFDNYENAIKALNEFSLKLGISNLNQFINGSLLLKEYNQQKSLKNYF